MTEQLVDPQKLKDKALIIVERLNEAAQNHQRTYPADIQAVLVFSGPGTYRDRLKLGQSEWQRWMDRDRVRAGVAVVREVTVTRMYQHKIFILGSREATNEDILEYGPFFVYNGVPFKENDLVRHENEVLRQVICNPQPSERVKLPKEKILIIDEVRNPKQVLAIAHTGHQFLSFYQELLNPLSPLHKVRNVALVAHIPDFIRQPFYAQKYNDDFEKILGRRLNFWFYALKSRPGTEEAHLDAELQRLPIYAAKGDLATEPAPFST